MHDLERILSCIDNGEVIQVTRELVAIPSITHREGMGMVEYYKRWFRDLKIPMRVYPYDTDRANFFADFAVSSGPERFLFNGHQDVKPAEGMTIEPFAAEIRGERLYGRGTADMKGGIAAILCAFKAMVRAGAAPRKEISFFSDIEDEWDGAGGYLWALENGLLEGYAGVISAAGTGMELQIGTRGIYTAAFEVHGRSAHSGVAHLGVNAVHHMARFISEYLSLPYLRMKNPRFGKPTVNFERIEGGLYLSAVPDYCMVCLDSRLIPETPPELVQAQIEGLLDRLRTDEGITIRETVQPRGWRDRSTRFRAECIPADHPFTRRISEAYHRALGEPPVLGGCPAAALPMAMAARGVPAVICGPGHIAQAHTSDEWVEIDQIQRAVRVYTAIMAEA